MDETQPALELAVLDYHRSVVAKLRETEGPVWDWATVGATPEGQAEEARNFLLRETYRLDPEAHPDIYRICRTAADRLGVEDAVTLYQAGGDAMNAALHFIPGEVHLVLYGAILEKLAPEEQLALIGHELAHHRLWSMEDGAFHTAGRILDLALAHSNAAASHVETARLYQLHTELFADRGGALAAGAPGPMIAALVKTTTGAALVDADAYLRQTSELEGGLGPSAGASHPELFNRAQALDRWWRQDKSLAGWIDLRIRGRLCLEALDLPRQHQLTAMTRGFFARLLSDAELRSEAVLAQVERFFPDWGESEAPIDNASLAPDKIEDSVRAYLVALTFDLAMADPDLTERMLSVGARLAAEFQGLDQYREGLKRDLKLGRKQIERLTAKLAQAA